MQSKISSRRILLIVVLVGCAVSAAILFYFIPKSSNLPALPGGQAGGRQVQSGSAPLTANTTALFEQEKVNSGLPASPASPNRGEPPGRPVRLKIPGINVDTVLESVGLTPQGAVDVPKNPTNAAWFDLGPRPGDNGSAVITGHYGPWKNGEESVFNDLYKLRQGDKLYIEDDKGVIISFVVRASRRYNPKADARDVFGSNDGKPHLNLITCEGVWNKISKSYSERLVVFTDKEE